MRTYSGASVGLSRLVTYIVHTKNKKKKREGYFSFCFFRGSYQVSTTAVYNVSKDFSRSDSEISLDSETSQGAQGYKKRTKHCIE